MTGRPTSATWPSLIFCFYLKMLNMSDFKAEVCSLVKAHSLLSSRPLTWFIAPRRPWPLCLPAWCFKIIRSPLSPLSARSFKTHVHAFGASWAVEWTWGLEIESGGCLCLSGFFLEPLGAEEWLTHALRGWEALKEIIIGCIAWIFRVGLCSALTGLRLFILAVRKNSIFLSHFPHNIYGSRVDEVVWNVLRRTKMCIQLRMCTNVFTSGLFPLFPQSAPLLPPTPRLRVIFTSNALPSSSHPSFAPSLVN